MFYSWVSCIIPHDMQLRMLRTSPYGPFWGGSYFASRGYFKPLEEKRRGQDGIC